MFVVLRVTRRWSPPTTSKIQSGVTPGVQNKFSRWIESRIALVTAVAAGDYPPLPPAYTVFACPSAVRGVESGDGPAPISTFSVLPTTTTATVTLGMSEQRIGRPPPLLPLSSQRQRRSFRPHLHQNLHDFSLFHLCHRQTANVKRPSGLTLMDWWPKLTTMKRRQLDCLRRR